MSNMPSFDLFQQNVTLVDDTGLAFNTSLGDFDEFKLFGTQESIAMGVQIGACAILLIVLLLLTKPEKRLSAIFVLNSLALVFDIIRCVLETIYWTGPFVSSYAFFAQDYSRVPTSAYAQQVTGTLCTLLLQICVEISLCIQAHVVCVNLRQMHRQAILMVSILIALAALSIRFALMVKNDISIVETEPLDNLDMLDNAANITTTICIGWFCAIFIGKLGLALRERQKLGMMQFGPMQVIFIVGCQTLLVPRKYPQLSLTVYRLTIPSSHLLHHELLRGRIPGFYGPHHGGIISASLFSLGVGNSRRSFSSLQAEQFWRPDTWEPWQSLYGSYQESRQPQCSI